MMIVHYGVCALYSHDCMYDRHRQAMKGTPEINAVNPVDKLA